MLVFCMSPNWHFVFPSHPLLVRTFLVRVLFFSHNFLGFRWNFSVPTTCKHAEPEHRENQTISYMYLN